MLLKDILKIYNINPDDCHFFRYGLYEDIKDNINNMGVKEYCSNTFKTEKKFLLFFLGKTSTKSILKGAYKVGTFTPKEEYGGALLNDSKGYLKLDDLDELDELINRLEINYEHKQGWSRTSFDEIVVSALYPEEKARTVKEFNGLENIYLSYEELKEIVDNSYLDYVLPLKSISAIYMIIDKSSGKQYIGSAYGKDGLYGRWTSYVYTEGTGNNIMLEEFKEKDEQHYKNYYFHILRVLPQSMSVDEVIQQENKYKTMYLTRIYGLNKN